MAKRTRNSRNQISGIGGIIFTVIVVALLIAIGLVVKNIIALHIEKNDLEKQEQQLIETRDELTAELQSVDDLDYIEEQARKLLRMIKPGEVIYIHNGEDPRPETDQSDEEVVIPPIVTEEDAKAEEAATEEEWVGEDFSYDASQDGTAEEWTDDGSGDGTGEEWTGDGTGEDWSGDGNGEEWSGEGDGTAETWTEEGTGEEGGDWG